MKCPACPASELLPLKLRADLEAEVCGACHGAWLDRSEIYQFVKNVERLQEELGKAYGSAKPSPRPCPRCGRAMVEVRVESADVSFEACPGCEGNWFDASEVSRLRAAVDRPAVPTAAPAGTRPPPAAASPAKAAAPAPSAPAACREASPTPSGAATFSITRPPETGAFIAALLGLCGLLAFAAGWVLYFFSPGSIQGRDIWIAGGVFAGVTVAAYLILAVKR